MRISCIDTTVRYFNEVRIGVLHFKLHSDPRTLGAKPCVHYYWSMFSFRIPLFYYGHDLTGILRTLRETYNSPFHLRTLIFHQSTMAARHCKSVCSLSFTSLRGQAISHLSEGCHQQWSSIRLPISLLWCFPTSSREWSTHFSQRLGWWCYC